MVVPFGKRPELMGCGASSASLPREGVKTPLPVERGPRKVIVHRAVVVTLPYFVQSMALDLSQSTRNGAALLLAKSIRVSYSSSSSDSNSTIFSSSSSSLASSGRQESDGVPIAVPRSRDCAAAQSKPAQLPPMTG